MVADGLLDLRGGEAQGKGDFAGLEGLHADGGLDADAHDGVGLLFGDVLDFHAARGGGHDHHAFGFAIEHEAQIEFAGDGHAAFDIEAVDDLAGGAGLVRHQLLAEQFVGGVETSSSLRQSFTPPALPRPPV